MPIMKKYSLLISALVLGTSIVIASCKKAEEAKVKRVKESEEVQAYIPKQGLASAMKKASLVMRRLARAVKNNDWVEMDMWTKELKEGIGHNCVELYMIENNNISSEFVTLSNKFNSAINKLILCSKEHDANSTNPEFNNLINSCDACHEGFNKDMKGQLDFTGPVDISLNRNDETN